MPQESFPSLGTKALREGESKHRLHQTKFKTNWKKKIIIKYACHARFPHCPHPPPHLPVAPSRRLGPGASVLMWCWRNWSIQAAILYLSVYLRDSLNLVMNAPEYLSACSEWYICISNA